MEKHAHDFRKDFWLKKLGQVNMITVLLDQNTIMQNLWTKGISMNCFRTRHIDLDKEFNYPDDPEDVSHLSYKRYFEKNNIVLPKNTNWIKNIYFFAPNVKDKGIELNYYINPEFYGAPKNN